VIEGERIRVCGLELWASAETLPGSLLPVELAVEPVPGLADSFLLRCRVASGGAESAGLAALSIRWSVPVVDMHGFYAPPPSAAELAGLPYWRFEKRSAAYSGVPFFSLLHRGGENRFAFGLLDQVTEAQLEATLSEATREYSFRWHKRIGEQLPAEETLFVSAARRPWSDVLRAYVETVDRDWPQPKLPVPEFAYDPVFCSWTAIHHDVSQEWVLRNAELAADLGFGTWLTDDGWFTEKAQFADYRFTGDWQPAPEKFPDFADHVGAVQALGLRYLLWVAPFMVGDASRAAKRLARLLSEPTHALGYRNLSPRHPETATIVGDLVERLLRNYHLDGLKIDFIDSISDDGLAGDEGRRGVGEGLYAALSLAIDRARQVRPELLVEVRNSYANLASRRYANLYRASDVPLNFGANRWQVTMLRLLAPDRAVHLDPVLWHPDDSDEDVATHLINAIVSVPTISVELDRYRRSHLELVRHWIGFYREHREAIVHGEFAPEIRPGTVPLIRFKGSTERIVGVYDDVAFPLGADDPRPAWILNASTRPYVELLPDGSTGARRVVARNRFGRQVSDERVSLPAARLPVEVGGLLEVRSG
jgi:alpha-galactosidase